MKFIRHVLAIIRSRTFAMCIGITMVLNFCGCSDSYTVGKCSLPKTNISIRLLDSASCDFARYIKIEITAGNQHIGPFDFLLLNCGTKFDLQEYDCVVSRSKRYLALVRRTALNNEGKVDEFDVAFVYDLEESKKIEVSADIFGDFVRCESRSKIVSN